MEDVKQGPDRAWKDWIEHIRWGEMVRIGIRRLEGVAAMIRLSVCRDGPEHNLQDAQEGILGYHPTTYGTVEESDQLVHPTTINSTSFHLRKTI